MRKNCSKVVVENFFEPCILYLLMEKPSYGYELNQRLLNNCDCNVNIANLYRCLSKLTKDGFVIKNKVKSSIGPDRAEYLITEKGLNLLKEWIHELEAEMKTVNKLIINYKKFHENNIIS